MSNERGKRFRVAFSFAGEKREFVSQVAAILAARFSKAKILYDKYHEAEFARRDLGLYLPSLYHDESNLVVVVICPGYQQKQWCGLEWDAIFALLKKRKDTEVMLCRFDHAAVHGLYDTAGFVELDDKTPDQAAALVLERLALNEGKPTDFYHSRIKRRIYVSMPSDRWLTPNQNELKWGIVKEIERLGYTPEIFTDPTGRDSLAAGKAWSASEADRVARRCVGAAIIGLPRWLFTAPQGDVKLPTEYCHYEGAMAYTLGLPMLVVVQDDVQRRVVFDPNFHGLVSEFHADADRSWLETREFQVPFKYWKEELSKRRDVFLGYSDTSEGIANDVKRFLEENIGASVLDRETHFARGRSLQGIEEAATHCSAGLFLFTKDDELTDDASTYKAVSRDNIVFEAGYFISKKGKDHVLIVRESGTKKPADPDDYIYAALQDRSNIVSIQDRVRGFVEGL
jgi:hypothetical protein